MESQDHTAVQVHEVIQEKTDRPEFKVLQDLQVLTDHEDLQDLPVREDFK